MNKMDCEIPYAYGSLAMGIRSQFRHKNWPPMTLHPRDLLENGSNYVH